MEMMDTTSLEVAGNTTKLMQAIEEKFAAKLCVIVDDETGFTLVIPAPFSALAPRDILIYEFSISQQPLATITRKGSNLIFPPNQQIRHNLKNGFINDLLVKAIKTF